MTSTAEFVLVGAAVVVLACGGFWTGWEVKGWRDAAAQSAAIEKQAAAYSLELSARDSQITALEKRHEDAVSVYETELTQLRTTIAARPVPVVRLCPSAPHPAVPQAGHGIRAAGIPDATAAARIFPSAPGRDLGPALYAEADRADAIVAQCRALQSLSSP